MPTKVVRPALYITLCLVLLTGGCTVGPAYHKPSASVPAAFGETKSSVNTNEPVAEWWNEFHDPELTRLVDQVLRSNYDLQIATMRIRESRLQRNITAADLFPQVDANGSFTHARGSKNVVLPLGGSGGSGSSSGGSGTTGSGKSKILSTREDPSSGGNLGADPTAIQPSPFGQGGLPGSTTDLYQVGFDATWEIDVFGGKRREVQAATAEVQQAEAGRHALQVSLAAETARDYLQLRGSQQRLRIAGENLAAQKDVLALTTSMRNSGLANDLDVVRAAAEVEATESSMPPLEAETRRWMHSLSVLAAREPNDLSAELTKPETIPSVPPEVPIGLPSQLLRRRADIEQAEREIAAASARIGVAQADLFPKFALIGTAGLDSSTPGTLFNWESRYFLISPTVAWRIFDAGRIAANIRLQSANEQEAVLQYRSSILKALQEVEDALVNYASEQTRRIHLKEEAARYQQALELARMRYDQGLTDFLNVLDAERSLFTAQDELAVSDLAVSSDLVALYKSLGGGWK